MLSLLPWPFGSQPRCTCHNYAHTPQCALYSSDPNGSNEKETVDTVAELLAHYATPSGARPPSARVDPTLPERLRKAPGMGVSDLWNMSAFLASKVSDIATDLVSHHIWGPRKKSWGVRMTLLSSVFRGVGQHSRVADIAMIRLFLQIGALFPLPADALVTPVSFRIKSRQLRGMLAPFDELEYRGAKGKSETPTEPRELGAEWVVGKALWTRLNRQWLRHKQLSGATNHRIPERVVLYFHGGAYYVFNAATHRLITIPLSKYADARVFSVNYRLAPETRFPGALHDAVHAYRRLTDELHVPPSRIIVAGDSAGGGLTLALLMYLRDEGYELPSGAILFSPWVDLTMSCDSWDSNAAFDLVPRTDADDPLNPVACYLGWGEGMQQYLTHPYASPLFGDFKGLPPLLIQSGEAEVLRDEITLLAHKATLAGVDVRHELFEDAVHVFQMFSFLPTTRRAFQNVRLFVKELDRKMSASSQTTPEADLGLGSEAEKTLAQEMKTNAEGSRVVRGDGVEVASGREAGLELSAEDQSDGEFEESAARRTGTSSTALGLDLGTPPNERGARSDTSSPRRHRRGLTSPLIRMTPASPPISTQQDLASPPRSLSTSWLGTRPSSPSSGHATPQQSVRVRSRAASHPDIVELCVSFAAHPETTRTTTFNAQGEDE